MSKTIKPFRAASEAAYWGGGVVVVPADEGGYYALYARTYPGGADLYTIGPLDPAVPHITDGREGLPEGYVFATPDDGGAKCICRTSK